MDAQHSRRISDQARRNAPLQSVLTAARREAASRCSALMARGALLAEKEMLLDQQAAIENRLAQVRQQLLEQTAV